jgi:methionyl-tRNA formyltransferase
VESVNTASVKAQILEYEPDFLFVIGWSRLVDSEVIEIPSVAALGMHPAPLPRGRGRAPLAWSIIKGLDETALSLFHLVKEADAGDIVGQKPLPIDIEDDTSSLYQKMVEAGRTLIRDHYPEFSDGDVRSIPQDESRATWWPKREPHHGLIDWNQRPDELYNWIRGQSRPYPGAFSYLNGKKITIWSANPPKEESSFVRPGEIAYQDGSCLGVGVWEGILEITEIEVESKGAMSASSLLLEYGAEIGDQFENARDRLC